MTMDRPLPGRSTRLGVVALHGAAQAIPLALTAGTLQAWLADAKVDISVIGWFTLVNAAYVWKFAWAPLFDRYPCPWLGARRGWVVILQLLAIPLLALLAWIGPTSSLPLFACAALLVAVVGASHDIVTDAYRTELLPPAERGPGASFVNVGARLGLLLCGAGALILADHIAWRYIYLLFASVLLLSALITTRAPEPAVRPVRPTSLRDAVVDPLREFFARRGAWLILLIVALYKIGDAFSVSLLTPFLMEHGYTKTEIGSVLKGMGMLATIIGSLGGGVLTMKLGIKRALIICGVLQALSNFGYIYLHSTPTHLSTLIAVIGIDQFCAGLGNAPFLAFFMELCRVEFAGTQYALLSSLMAVPRTFIGAPAGYIAKYLGWNTFFALSIVIAVPALWLIARIVPKRAAA